MLGSGQTRLMYSRTLVIMIPKTSCLFYLSLDFILFFFGQCRYVFLHLFSDCFFINWRNTSVVHGCLQYLNFICKTKYIVLRNSAEFPFLWVSLFVFLGVCCPVLLHPFSTRVIYWYGWTEIKKPGMFSG